MNDEMTASAVAELVKWYLV